MSLKAATAGSDQICLNSSAPTATNADRSQQHHTTFGLGLPWALPGNNKSAITSFCSLMPKANASCSDEVEIFEDPRSSGIALEDFYKTEEAKPVTVLSTLSAETAPWSKVSPEPYL